MPRYHFHLSGTVAFDDVKGRHLPDEKAAWSIGISSAGEMLRDLDGKLPDHTDIVMTVTDESDRMIFTLQILARKNDGHAIIRTLG